MYSVLTQQRWSSVNLQKIDFLLFRLSMDSFVVKEKRNRGEEIDWTFPVEIVYLSLFAITGTCGFAFFLINSLVRIVKIC